MEDLEDFGCMPDATCDVCGRLEFSWYIYPTYVINDDLTTSVRNMCDNCLADYYQSLL